MLAEIYTFSQMFGAVFGTIFGFLIAAVAAFFILMLGIGIMGGIIMLIGKIFGIKV